MQGFIKKMVEAGTEDRYTLLSHKKHLGEPQHMQKLMRELIIVKNNTCEHFHEIALGEFIKNN